MAFIDHGIAGWSVDGWILRLIQHRMDRMGTIQKAEKCQRGQAAEELVG